MPDGNAASRLDQKIQFRLSGRDYALLAEEAEASRLRVNELARQLVAGRAQRGRETLSLDPAIVLQLQEIGLRLRPMLPVIGDDPALRFKVAEVCRRIERLVDVAVSGGSR
ncbi:hypothetical protein [Luteolibacter sp. Populi]|uniref:hypothetical protein n=1 Tax=Luteolibacter sp. Populi TaxID=3230487 RepID=UPI003466E015